MISSELGLLSVWSRRFSCHQGLMLSVFCCAICNVVSPDGCRMKDDTPSSTTSGNSNQQESRLVDFPQDTPYVKEEDFSQKPPCVSLARSASHSISNPVPDNRSPGSMTGLDQSTMLLLVERFNHFPGTRQGEGPNEKQDSSPKKEGLVQTDCQVRRQPSQPQLPSLQRC